MSTSFTSESHAAHRSDPSHFRLFSLDGALHLFLAVDTEAEVDALEAAIPLLEPSSTVAVAEASESCSDAL